MSRLVSSFDPDADGRNDQYALSAAGRDMFIRFVRIRGEERWERLHPARQQVWIDDFAVALDAYRSAGGRA